MKKLAAVLLLFASPVFAATGRSMLICRMGGAMTSSVVTSVEVVPTNINGKNVRVPNVTALFAQLIFSKASAPVAPDGAGLSPGVCGWTDRAMSADEPNRVIERLDEYTINSSVLWGNGSTIGGSTTFSGGHLHQQNKAVFAISVTRTPGDVQFYVAEGTTPKVVAK